MECLVERMNEVMLQQQQQILQQQQEMLQQMQQNPPPWRLQQAIPPPPGQPFVIAHPMGQQSFASGLQAGQPQQNTEQPCTQPPGPQAQSEAQQAGLAKEKQAEHMKEETTKDTTPAQNLDVKPPPTEASTEPSPAAEEVSQPGPDAADAPAEMFLNSIYFLLVKSCVFLFGGG